MYLPDDFAERDPARLADLIEADPFGTLITVADGAPLVSHLPFLVDRNASGALTLRAHLARANPHWPALDGSAATAVFLGPHAYVSPRWYDRGPAVPTWNYVAVHAKGSARLVEDHAAVEAIVTALADRFEASAAAPWSFAETPVAFRRAMLDAIVGVEIRVETILGKRKLSQNRPAADRGRVAAALARSPRGGDRDLAALMAEPPTDNR